MNGNERKKAWTDYWTMPGAAGGCLPKAMQRLQSRLAHVWQEAARGLPRGAKVLDLATGDGVVLRAMRAARPDLKLVGIDSAAKLPAPPKGIALKAGISMEALPYPDGAFDLATSQFGFEYGDARRIAPELARVIAPGGGFRFVLHHEGSPVVAHNAARRDALAWAAVESGLLDRARALAAARERMQLATPPSFGEAVREAGRLFPAQPVAAEFAMAVHQTLELGRRSPPRETLQALATLEARARGEMARIDALRDAASDPAGIAILSDHLTAAGFSTETPAILAEDRADPIAWILSGKRG